MSVHVLNKPARLQVDPETITEDDKPPQTGTTFNIWFLKWSGGDSSSKDYVKLKFRVSIKRDSGRTKASKRSPICLFFARGCCYKGPDCLYRHQLPLAHDYVNPTQDCFGRDKTADYKDDMDGVGSFNRHNRTLYVGGLTSESKTEGALLKSFQEFGTIESIRVLHSKGCAFVTFKLEVQAQFAKEAMQSQSLNHNEVLNIRWASEDPNPNAQRQEQRRLEERASETVQYLLSTMEESKSKRRKIETAEDANAPVKEQAQIASTPDSIFSAASLKALKLKAPVVPTQLVNESQSLLQNLAAYDSD